AVRPLIEGQYGLEGLPADHQRVDAGYELVVAVRLAATGRQEVESAIRPRDESIDADADEDADLHEGSAAREGKPERRHLVIVADQQGVAGHRRVVPSLPLEGREARQLVELVRGGPHERQLPLLGQHEQQILIGEEDQLSMPVSAPLPLALSLLEVDA